MPPRPLPPLPPLPPHPHRRTRTPTPRLPPRRIRVRRRGRPHLRRNRARRRAPRLAPLLPLPLPRRPRPVPRVRRRLLLILPLRPRPSLPPPRAPRRRAAPPPLPPPPPRRHRRPPALPACLAALLLRLPFVLQDQDAGPAPATRLLTPFARRVFLAFNAPVRLLPKRKCAVYGNPVRMSIRKCRVSKAATMARFFPRAGLVGEEGAKVVLVLGGTVGSPEINVAVLNMYYEMLRERRDMYIIWQTGPEGFCEMESLVRGHRRLFLTPFLHEMDMAYAAADVVVSRAGSMTCTEILATGKPAILIPLPTIVDDHQTKNAYIMADVMGAKVITEDELDSSSLTSIIDEVFGDEKLMADMSQKALNAARPNASADIIRHICSLVGSSYPT